MDPNEPSPDLPVMMPEPSAEPPKSNARKQWIAAGVGAVVVAGAALIGMQVMKSDSSGTSANATPDATAAGVPNGAQRQGGVPGTRGTITSIDDSTLTVETSDGDSVTVTTDNETTVTKTEDGSVSDIAVGDNLLVMGTSSGSQTAAETIVDSGGEALGGGFRGGGPSGNGELPDRGQLPDGVQPPSGGQFPDGVQPPNGGQFPDGGQPPNGGSFTPPVVGSVTSIDNGTITLETVAGETVTVTTSSSTEITVRRSAQVSDLAEGDTILVVGETSGNEVAATAISEGAGGGFGPGGGRFPGAPPGGSSGNGAGDPST